MTRTWEDIYTQIQARRSYETVLFRQMIAVRDRYNADVVFPNPDVDGEPTIPAPTPRLIADAIDSTAMRAASVTPSVFCPALDAVKQTGVRSREYATIRRRAIYANWHYSALKILLLRAYRHMCGYGTAAFVVVPDFADERAKIEIRDPLTAYPELRTPDDVREPRNCAFVYGRSPQWLTRQFPNSAPWVERASVADQLWDVAEWLDEDDIVIGLLGPRAPGGQSYIDQNGSSGWSGVGLREYSTGMELKRVPNRAGMVPVATPRRVTLDRIFSQVANVVGTVDLMEKLMVLDYLASEKGVFPDMAIVGENGRIPTILGGQWEDGRTGAINVVLDGKPFVLQTSPGPMSQQTISTLERAARLSSGNPSMTGGELTGSLRSGQTLNSLAGLAVDPRIQEAHTLMERSLSVVNSAVLAVEKGYWPSKRYTCFSGLPGDEQVEYTPATHFETVDNAVTYPFPGLDISQVSVAIPQLVGANLLSQQSGRYKHPLVDNPEHEERQTMVERIDNAMLTGLLQQASAGTLPPIDIAALRLHLDEGMSLPDAVIAAHKDAQARQATQAAPPDQTQGQVQAPGAQPGLSMPGMGAEQVAPQPDLPPAGTQIAPPTTDQVDMHQLLRNLRAAG